MILNENQLNIQKQCMFLSEQKNFPLNEDGKLKEIVRLHSNKLEKIIAGCARFAKTAVAKNKFKHSKLTGNIAEIKELLEPDCVQGFILAGEKSCKIILFPFLDEYFSNKVISNKEKEAKLTQLKDDLKEVERIAKEEFDKELKDNNEKGIAYFKKNIADIVSPFKF